MGVGIQLRDTLSSLRMIQNKNIDIPKALINALNHTGEPYFVYIYRAYIMLTVFFVLSSNQPLLHSIDHIIQLILRSVHANFFTFRTAKYKTNMETMLMIPISTYSPQN